MIGRFANGAAEPPFDWFSVSQTLSWHYGCKAINGAMSRIAAGYLLEGKKAQGQVLGRFIPNAAGD
jgi:hypothetical protein